MNLLGGGGYLCGDGSEHRSRLESSWYGILISSSKGELLLCAKLCTFTKYLAMASALS